MGRGIFSPTTWVFLAALVYGGLHLAWYWQTPFGIAPVLDEKENLQLARQIADGTLAAEPFYRAMGYPLLLSILPAAGLPAAFQPMAATALGLLLHAAGSVLVAQIALRIGASRSAALFSGALHALHPALVHHATQILDGTFATILFLCGLLALLPERTQGDVSVVPESDAGMSGPLRSRSLAAATAWNLSWSLAALVRPQFLVLAPIGSLLWIWLRPKDRRAAPLAAGVLAFALPWLALGTWQHAVSGQFRVMPTQGAYNLWAANRPGADGRYFKQLVHLPAGDHQNPTRVESLVLFERETGHAASSLDEANAHWSARLQAALREDPLAWLRLLARKTYHLLNDFDAYNNKTYAFHKARSPWLSPNPLGWGVVFTAGTLGCVLLLTRRVRGATALLLVFLCLAVGLLLTYVSGRFRTPLTALLCIFAAGVIDWRSASRIAKCAATAAAALAAGVTFSGFLGAHDTSTFLQDQLLLAASAVESGEDAVAWDAAGAALARSPGHPDALAWRLTAGFNRVIRKQLTDEEGIVWLHAARQFVTSPHTKQSPPPLFAIAGLAFWRAGDASGALKHWQTRWQQHHEAPSIDALRLARQFNPTVWNKALSAQDVSERDLMNYSATTPIPAGPAPSDDVFSRMLAAATSGHSGTREESLRRLAHDLFVVSP